MAKAMVSLSTKAVLSSFCVAMLAPLLQAFLPSTAMLLHRSAFVPTVQEATLLVARRRGGHVRRRLIIAQITPGTPDDEEDEEKKKRRQPEKAGDLALPHDGGVPLSYRSDNGTRDSEFYLDAAEQNVNPYFDVVRRLSPAELIGRFVKTSNPKVQEAVKTTVLGLLGSLPRHAIQTTAISTGSALANLMFQLQMTGYMFKNAEYRLSLQTSLRASNALPGSEPESQAMEASDGAGAIDAESSVAKPKPKITGKIKLMYDNQQEIEVDAEAYMAELTGQVETLSMKLRAVSEEREAMSQKDLLAYIKAMPAEQIGQLSANISPEVLEAMKTLVNTVMQNMGVPGGPAAPPGAAAIIQQPGAGMAQLCMWQLVVGYNLREMEAREEIRKRFEGKPE